MGTTELEQPLAASVLSVLYSTERNGKPAPTPSVLTATFVLILTFVLLFVLAAALLISVLPTAIFLVAATLIGRWGVDVSVPVLLHKINLLPTSVVGGAVLSPFLGMTGRHSQINRLLRHRDRRGTDHQGLRINHDRGRIVANVYTAIKARLTNRN